MAQYTGPLLAVAAIGAVGAYTPSQEFQRNFYSSLDDCRRDYGGTACSLEQTNGAVRVFGPWYTGERAGASASDAVSQVAIGVVTEIRRGGFGGWSCDGGEGGGGGG